MSQRSLHDQDDGFLDLNSEDISQTAGQPEQFESLPGALGRSCKGCGSWKIHDGAIHWFSAAPATSRYRSLQLPLHVDYARKVTCPECPLNMQFRRTTK